MLATLYPEKSGETCSSVCNQQSTAKSKENLERLNYQQELQLTTGDQHAEPVDVAVSLLSSDHRATGSQFDSSAHVLGQNGSYSETSVNEIFGGEPVYQKLLSRSQRQSPVQNLDGHFLQESKTKTGLKLQQDSRSLQGKTPEVSVQMVPLMDCYSRNGSPPTPCDSSNKESSSSSNERGSNSENNIRCNSSDSSLNCGQTRSSKVQNLEDKGQKLLRPFLHSSSTDKISNDEEPKAKTDEELHQLIHDMIEFYSSDSGKNDIEKYSLPVTEHCTTASREVLTESSPKPSDPTSVKTKERGETSTSEKHSKGCSPVTLEAAATFRNDKERSPVVATKIGITLAEVAEKTVQGDGTTVCFPPEVNGTPAENKINAVISLSENKGVGISSVKVLKASQYEDISDPEESAEGSIKDPSREDISSDENSQSLSMTLEVISVPTEVSGATSKKHEHVEGQDQMESISDEDLIQEKRTSQKMEIISLSHQSHTSPSVLTCQEDTEDEADSEDESDSEWMVFPVNMLGVKWEPTGEADQEDSESILHEDDGEHEVVEEQRATDPLMNELPIPDPTPEPDSAFSQMEVFDTPKEQALGQFGQVKVCTPWSFKLPLSWCRSKTPDAPQNRRETQDDDDCDTEDSCDYSSDSGHNFMTPLSSDGLEAENENEGIENLQVCQIISKKADIAADAVISLLSDSEDENNQSSAARCNRELTKNMLERRPSPVDSPDLECLTPCHKEVRQADTGTKTVNKQGSTQRSTGVIIISDSEDENNENGVNLKDQAVLSSEFSSDGDAPSIEKGRNTETLHNSHGAAKGELTESSLSQSHKHVNLKGGLLLTGKIKKLIKVKLHPDQRKYKEKKNMKLERLLQSRTSGDSAHSPPQSVDSGVDPPKACPQHVQQMDSGRIYSERQQEKEVIKENVSKKTKRAISTEVDAADSGSADGECGPVTSRKQNSGSAGEVPERQTRSVESASTEVCSELKQRDSRQGTFKKRKLKQPSIEKESSDHCYDDAQNTFSRKKMTKESHLSENSQEDYFQSLGTDRGIQRLFVQESSPSGEFLKLVAHSKNKMVEPSSKESDLSKKDVYKTVKGKIFPKPRPPDHTHHPTPLSESREGSCSSTPAWSSSKPEQAHAGSNTPIPDYPPGLQKGPSNVTSTKEQIRNSWQRSFVPTRRDRKSSLEEGVKIKNHYDSRKEAKPGPHHHNRLPRRRHSSHESVTPLMKRTKFEAMQWTQAINREASFKRRFPVSEGYKWKNKTSAMTNKRHRSPPGSYQ